MPCSRRALISIAALGAVTLLNVVRAYGGENGGGPVTEHKNAVTITFSSTTNTQYKAGSGNTGGTDGVPLCWYESIGDSAEFGNILDILKSGNFVNPWSGFDD